jgi:glycosyltransferase involved in cell wall biosynthesis
MASDLVKSDLEKADSVPDAKQRKVVAILLATYNGAEFLEEQLESLKSQTHANIDVWISDNGSTDSTLQVAQRKAKDWKKGNFTILTNVPRPMMIGAENCSEWIETGLIRSRDNFVSLILNRNIEADYYAYCDQDDVWEEDKLSAAIQKIEAANPDKAAMYCSRTLIIDSSGRDKKLSTLFRRKPCFRNAIVQNIAAGNTIVINQMAMDLLRRYTKDKSFIGHDWWTYLVVTAFDGVVIYDAYPRTRYRQHGANVIGQNTSWDARLKRIGLLLMGRFRYWNRLNIQAIREFVDELPPENRETFQRFEHINRSGPIVGAYHLYKSDIFRQNKFDQAMLYLGCLLGRV